MAATHAFQFTTTPSPVLYMAMELSTKNWKLAFTVGMGQAPRIRTVAAGGIDSLMNEVRKTRVRFGLPEGTPVLSCYEAGRDGFWIHRCLLHRGLQNNVVDSASIEVSRRKRRPKTDRLDAVKLVSMLVRWHYGDKKVWSVVHVPTVASEDGRQLHRELVELKGERTTLVNRIKGLVAGLGLRVKVDGELPATLESLRQWDDTPVPPALKRRVLHEFERWQLIGRQIDELETQRRVEIRTDPAHEGEQVRRLMEFRGIGPNGAWLLVREFFGWREIRNRRELASLAGLTPTPYNSGGIQHEQGISKAGNRLVRWVMVELAWCWLEYQPGSELSRWYRRRFGGGNSGQRKVGIVALARKLLVALWRYLKGGEVPEGAVLVLKKGVHTKQSVVSHIVTA
jgi:transposase